MTTATTENSIPVRIAAYLERTIGPRRYSMWFDRSVRFDYHDPTQELQVAVPNQFVADWIDRHFKQQLHLAAQHEVGQSVGLKVLVKPSLFTKQPDRGPALPAASTGATPTADRSATTPWSACPDPTPTQTPRRQPRQTLRHQLEDFVVGPSNELAFTAANRVIEDQTYSINPLFIHGGCGLGKTHLLQGICHKVQAVKPHGRVLYTTGEQFTNDFLLAMRTNKLDAFRKKTRALDLLAIDDVQFIANKQATQQEFLHSFDTIQLSGARVILASDSHPTLIEKFSQALISRCVRGMVVQVHQPDFDTRVQLIQTLAHRRGMLIQDPAVESLASRCIGSVRHIEGTLTQLHALAHLSAKRQPGGWPMATPGSHGVGPIGHTLIQQLFHADFRPTRRSLIRFPQILNAVCKHLKIDRAQVLGNSRHKNIVLARSLAVYLAREMTTMSYPEIAAAAGRRTHSTVVAAVQRIQKQLKANPTIAIPTTMEQTRLVELVEQLKHAIETGVYES